MGGFRWNVTRAQALRRLIERKCPGGLSAFAREVATRNADGRRRADSVRVTLQHWTGKEAPSSIRAPLFDTVVSALRYSSSAALCATLDDERRSALGVGGQSKRARIATVQTSLADLNRFMAAEGGSRALLRVAKLLVEDNYDLRAWSRIGWEHPGLKSLDFRLMGPGFFSAGSPEDEKNRKTDERQRTVVFPYAFFVGRYPITEHQWSAAMPAENGEGPRPTTRPVRSSGFLRAAAPSEGFPKTCVSFFDARRFAGELASSCWQDGLVEAPFRLLTEEEWEYACRGGTTDAYFFGKLPEDGLKRHAWYGANSRERLHPVGKKLANHLGLYDMLGNVWEWTNSPFARAPVPGRPVSYVIRGGAYDNPSRTLRCARRSELLPKEKREYVGFRIGLTIELGDLPEILGHPTPVPGQ
jgi:formylglycine-generating enzyme required for sulfatase activity